MKKLLILGLCVSLAGCGTTGMQGNPAAIMVGAQVGGMVGSIIGGSNDNYAGWAIGNILGTVAGAAVGNAVSIPHQSQQQSSAPYTYQQQQQQQDNSYPEPASSDERNDSRYSRQQQNYNTPALPITIQNIRFVDENNDHVIQAGEFCKLIFELYNAGDQTVNNIYPNIVLSTRRVGVSNPALIQSLKPGQRIRYTASVYGYKSLREGSVDFTVTACQQNGPTGDQRQFTLNTQR